MVNTGKLQHELDHIAQHRESWHQGMWASLRDDRRIQAEVSTFQPAPDRAGPTERHNLFPIPNCQAAYCLAGGAAVHNGYVFVAHPGEIETGAVIANADLPKLNQPGDSRHIRDAQEVGREVLELEGHESTELFSGSNTYEELWAFAYALTDGRIILPADLTEEGLEEMLESIGTGSRIVEEYCDRHNLATPALVPQAV